MQEVIAWRSPQEAWLYHNVGPYMFDICKWIAIISGSLLLALFIYAWIQDRRAR